MKNWNANLELWQKIMYANVVFAVVGGIIVYLFPYDWTTDIYLGVIIATGIAITVIGVIERRLRGEKILGPRGQKKGSTKIT